jgi:uncharacterized protein YceK
MKSLLFLVLLATLMPGCKKVFDHYNPDKDKDNNYTGLHLYEYERY